MITQLLMILKTAPFGVIEKYEFFGVVDGLVTVFDGHIFFCFCSKCIVEIRTRYILRSLDADSSHEDCIPETDEYFYERVSRELRGQYIFQIWDLCRPSLINYLKTIKGDLMTCFHLNVLR